MSRVIVARLTNSTYEGQWIEVHEAPEVSRPYRGWVALVPTGDVEWDGDRCAEVWVPANKLDLWMAEHHVE